MNGFAEHCAKVLGESIRQHIAESMQRQGEARADYYLMHAAGKFRVKDIAVLLDMKEKDVRAVVRKRGLSYLGAGWYLTHGGVA